MGLRRDVRVLQIATMTSDLKERLPAVLVHVRFNKRIRRVFSTGFNTKIAGEGSVA